MRRLEIVQLGLGHVGRAVAQILLEERKRWLEGRGIEVRYRAVSDTSGALVGEDLLPRARYSSSGDPMQTTIAAWLSRPSVHGISTGT